MPILNGPDILEKSRIGAIKAALQWQDQVSKGFNEAGIGNPNLPSSATPVLAPALLSQHKGLSFITTMTGEQQQQQQPQRQLDPIEEEEAMDIDPFDSHQTSNLENSENSGVDAGSAWWNPRRPSSSTTEPQATTATTASLNNDDDDLRPPTNYQQVTQQRKQTGQTTTTARNPRDTQSMTSRTFSPDPVAPLFYDPKSPLAYSGMDLKKFKRLNTTLSRHKQYRSRFQTNPVIATNLYTCFYADTVVYYEQDAENNAGYKYILVVVDGLSRRAFCKGLMTRTASETAVALDSIFETLDLPGHSFFMTDRGGEFFGDTLKVLEKYGMTPVYLAGSHKSAIAERFM